VDDSGRALIGDFGLARIQDEYGVGFTQSLFSGTVRFLPPELLIDDTPTTESDVHSLACTCAQVRYRRPLCTA
jgi:serine/threonine protein kinase